jgi:acyl-CoA thioester hydrolase
MGVVYHGNYFTWFEVGRVELLRQLGWSYKTLEADGISLPVVEATCHYRHPARYDDELEIRTVGRMTTAVRVEFTYELVRLEGARVLATARTLHVPVNREGRPCRLPAALRETFQ